MNYDLQESLHTKGFFKNLDKHQQGLVESYLNLLFKFNKSKKLTNIRDLDYWLLTQIEDCILAYSHLTEYSEYQFYDSGSGNGLPGIIFKILNPDLNICLVDLDKKKGEFLKTVVYRLSLAKIDVFTGDLLEIKANVPRRTVFIYRAFSPQHVQFKNIQNNPLSTHIIFSSNDIKEELSGYTKKRYLLSNNEVRNILISPEK